MSAQLLIIPAILLIALVSFSIYEQQGEGYWPKCLGLFRK
jgi:hypothetical protein